ncbi:MAG: hypothetical protein WKF80_04750 [Thermomicrobiales bacterium]
MDNSPRLPLVTIGIAAVATLLTALSYFSRGGNDEVVFSFNELEIGLVALVVTLLIFAVEGYISVLSEGRQLEPGRVAPRLTNPLTVAIIVASLVLFAVSITLGIGLVSDWDVWAIGWLAGGGCILLAIILVFYKEAFVGDEAHFDDRNDGVPW